MKGHERVKRNTCLVKGVENWGREQVSGGGGGGGEDEEEMNCKICWEFTER